MFINLHTHKPEQLNNCLSVLNRMPEDILDINNDAFYSYGIHPWFADRFDYDKMADFIQKPQFIAVGECGLDKTRGAKEYIQKNIFLQQVDLAEKFNKPIIIHCVKSFSEIVGLKKMRKTEIPWIIHGFNSNSNILNELTKNNFYFSVGEAILNPNSNIFKLLKKINSNRLFLETDNSDIQIDEIYNRVSAILNVNLVELQNIIKQNFKNCFNIEL